jgi:methyltransferase
MLSIVTLIAIVTMMLGELWLSRSNEEWMVAHGATTPPDPVYATMRSAYPLTFVVMAVEGAILDRPIGKAAIAGAALLVVAKALKFWAIASLGPRWTFRVLVLPGAPLVVGGPYRFIRHPNYVAVVGELLAMALLTGARITGPLSLLGFGWLLVRRIAAEERALGLSTRA